ncbi:RNA-binding cell elongation regulator Jag/EloR [Thermodesulfobacteriota bacterium]
MQPIEIEAKTVEEAISIACKQLNKTVEELHIEILESEPGKLLSFFSSRKAKIRASLNGESGAAHEGGYDELKVILETIAQHIYPEASVSISTQDEETIFTIAGDGSGIFIGKHGQTLDAFQYLMNKIRMNRCRQLPHISVDSELYRARHVDSLVGLAKRLSEKAKKRGAPVTTNPLSAADRRIIHMTLKKESGITTWSKGDGNLKKVIIAPKQS